MVGVAENCGRALGFKIKCVALEGVKPVWFYGVEYVLRLGKKVKMCLTVDCTTTLTSRR